MVMGQNFTGHEEEYAQITETRLVVDFSIFFIAGPLFLMFCIFLLWWDFFHGARVVSRYCLYFSSLRQAPQRAKATSHVEIYASSRMNVSGSPAEETIIQHVQTIKNLKVAHEYQNKATVVFSKSPSLPMLLDHNEYRGESSPGREQQPATMDHRDPSIEKGKPKKTYARKKKQNPRKTALMDSNFKLSKLSAERRAPPMWEQKYRNSKNNGGNSSDSEDFFLKARSEEIRFKRLSAYFPPNAHVFRRHSTLPLETEMRKTQSCNVQLKRRLSEFIPPEDMSKSMTSPGKKNSKSLEEYVPQHTPSIQTLGNKSPGEDSEGHHASPSLTTLQFDLQTIEQKLKSELQAVDSKIEKYKQKKSPTKAEMQASLAIFIPEVSNPPFEPELEETLTVKSERSPVSIAKKASSNHHRAKSWQSKTYCTTTLYE